MRNQRGVSLYISIVITVIILAIVLGVTTILVGQLKTVRGIEHSVIAFYAAEAGIEKVLNTAREAPYDPSGLDGDSHTLSNGATFTIEVRVSTAPGCNANNFCIKSRGNYRDAQRTIQVTY